MKISKSELVNALEIVRPGLANKEVVEQSTSFAFMDGRVVTYNDEISVSHPLPSSSLEGAVKAEELYQLLNKTKADHLQAVITGSELRLRAGKSKAGILLQQEVRLPLTELGEKGKWELCPKELKGAMEFAAFSCSSDQSKPILTCVHVSQSGTVESSNNLSITRYQLKKELPIGSFLLPAKSARQLLSHNFKEMAEGEGWVHFKTEAGTVFSCRVFDDDYPDVSPFLAVEGTVIPLPKELKEILDRAQIFSESGTGAEGWVSVRLEDGKISVRGEGEAGWYEEFAQVEYKEDPVNFSVSPSLLKLILIRNPTCILGGNCLKFQGQDWEHVIALYAENN